jgi:hypothetical protein
MSLCILSNSKRLTLYLYKGTFLRKSIIIILLHSNKGPTSPTNGGGIQRIYEAVTPHKSNTPRMEDASTGKIMYKHHAYT